MRGASPVSPCCSPAKLLSLSRSKEQVKGKQGCIQGFLAIQKCLDLPCKRETCIDGEASTWHSVHAAISSVLLNWDTHREEGQTDKASLGCGAMVPALGKICARCSPPSPAAPSAQRFL